MRFLRRRRAGQALVELALVLPFLTLLLLGAADLGRAFYLKTEITGAARAGMRLGVVGPSNDIGDAVRSEPNSFIPNTPAIWGVTAPGGSQGDCTSGTQVCGDPSGCPTSAFIGAQVACFAVATCTLNSSGVCATTPSWQTRPAANSQVALLVRVVYKLTPITPMIATYTGGQGSFYLTVDTWGLEMY